MIDTPDINIERVIDLQNPLKVKCSAVKSASTIYGVSKKFIQQRTVKVK